MTEEEMEARIRRAIGGDRTTVDEVRESAESSPSPRIVVLAGLLDGRLEWAERAAGLASTRCDRQTVAIAVAHLLGDHELVDALARDHLVDFPESLIVAWVASGAKADS